MFLFFCTCISKMSRADATKFFNLHVKIRCGHTGSAVISLESEDPRPQKFVYLELLVQSGPCASL